MESIESCSIAIVTQQGSVFDRPDVRLLLYPPEVPYQPMSKRELADLEREAERQFTPAQAERYRLRKLKRQLVDHMLMAAGAR
jgi:hypothetical protein